jgi:hypothetical protein
VVKAYIDVTYANNIYDNKKQKEKEKLKNENSTVTDPKP